MRRFVGFVVIGLGAALLTLGGTFRYWAYPRIAQVGAEYPSASDVKLNTTPRQGILVSTGRAEVFIAVEGHPVGPQMVDVTSTRTTKGDPTAANGNHVYWETRVDTTAPSITDKPLSSVIEGVCYGSRDAALASDCRKPAYMQTGTDAASRTTFDQANPRKGVYLKFPFQTQQITYDFWDTTSSKTFPAKFVGEDKIQGLPVYKFVQQIPDLSIGEMDVPGEAFGGPVGAAKADIRYANVRTLWVEPETGVIIRGQEVQDRRLVVNGVSKSMFVGTMSYSDATVAANVKARGDIASSLHGLRVTIPLWSLVIGLVLAVLGVVLVAGSSRQNRHGIERDAAAGSVDVRKGDEKLAKQG